MAVDATALTVENSGPTAVCIRRGLEFVVKEDIIPTQETMRVVVITASPVSYAASDAAIEVKRGDTVTTSFIVKKYSRYVPEVGVGATFSYFDRPKYLTSADAVTQAASASTTDVST